MHFEPGIPPVEFHQDGSGRVHRVVNGVVGDYLHTVNPHTGEVISDPPGVASFPTSDGPGADQAPAPV